jgi:hypothetical protein
MPTSTSQSFSIWVDTMGPTHGHVFVRATDDGVWSKAWS